MELKTRTGWEERLVKVDTALDVWLMWRMRLGADLGEDEVKRMEPKVKIVERAARKMLLNMIKGTLKYPSDEYDVRTWLRLLQDDGTDSLMYSYLLEGAIHEQVTQ
jgi:hypothetical protein